MPWDPVSDETMRWLEKSLVLSSRQQEIIAANVANLDTPGYTRKELDFAMVLKDYLGKHLEIGLAVTNPGHISGPKPTLSGMVRDTGREVDLDQEMVLMSKNQITYQASIQMLNKKLEQLRSAMEGGTR